MKIELIPRGKDKRITKKDLMRLAKIEKNDVFKEEFAKLRNKYIIMTDSENEGYWRPANKKELEDFIKKYQKKIYITSKAVMLAYKEIEEIERGKNNEK